MLHVTDVIQPKPGEHVEAVFRRERAGLVASLVLAGVCIALPFFFLFSLTRGGVLGVLAFALLLAVGITVGLRALLLWDANALIITNQRLVHVAQTRLWHRRVQEVTLSSIQELACESKGIWETMCRIGTLRVRASGAAQELVIERLSQPERARTTIQSLSGSPPSEASLMSSQGDAAELRKTVHTLVDLAPPSSLQTVKALLEKR